MHATQSLIPCTQMRGGTSKGTFFLADDLPANDSLRDSILLAVMGGPDNLQIDGVGGGHPLSSKVAIVSRSSRAKNDIDYLFLQISPTGGTVSTAQNCGNMLAAVGPFAIERGLVKAADGRTTVRVHMLNSGNDCELTVETPGGRVEYEGDARIDGVPGAAAPIICDYVDLAGSICGAMLPTGNPVDVFDGIETTCIDNGMPVVAMRATDLGISGYEAPEELDRNSALKEKLERIRLEAGPAMQLGDISDKSVPKLSLLAAAQHGGAISTRTFIPHDCHKSIGVLGAVTVATACILPDTVAAGMAVIPDGAEKLMDIEHAAGSLRTRLVTRRTGRELSVLRAGVIRTARMLFTGYVCVPRSVWDNREQIGESEQAVAHA
ncbi:MAG: 4-oxalomesaconate tautomerase [Woeseiaceae bacterium]|nr:4-oxalomesaconate tautomerase [Woeseiaceae bacterium]